MKQSLLSLKENLRIRLQKYVNTQSIFNPGSINYLKKKKENSWSFSTDLFLRGQIIFIYLSFMSFEA